MTVYSLFNNLVANVVFAFTGDPEVKSACLPDDQRTCFRELRQKLMENAVRWTPSEVDNTAKINARRNSLPGEWRCQVVFRMSESWYLVASELQGIINTSNEQQEKEHASQLILCIDQILQVFQERERGLDKQDQLIELVDAFEISLSKTPPHFLSLSRFVRTLLLNFGKLTVAVDWNHVKPDQAGLQFMIIPGEQEQNNRDLLNRDFSYKALFFLQGSEKSYVANLGDEKTNCKAPMIGTIQPCGFGKATYSNQLSQFTKQASVIEKIVRLAVESFNVQLQLMCRP